MAMDVCIDLAVERWGGSQFWLGFAEKSMKQTLMAERGGD